MYDYANNQYMINSLTRQKEKIDEMLKTYQNPPQPTPVNNFINTNSSQMGSRDLIEWRVLNENEEVDNLYVNNKTLFINDNLMVLKGVDGSLEKWKVTKIYPIDKKDEKINELEEEIKKLKEAINEHTEPISTIRKCEQPDGNVNVNVKPEPKTTSKSISKQEQTRAMPSDSRLLQ